ncbi:VWD domain-containing protein [Streptosporangium sp. OZ121]|uniref:VWD domain-containing protein n=1 Tax=Streptosporangium sp. OZ121 TaxID=3444183 RepID=UPI003F79A48E
MNTRGRIPKGPGCLLSRLNGPAEMYSKNQCGHNGAPGQAGIEYIGQARAVSHLNNKITGGSGQGEIHPDLQWETTFGVGHPRVDILYYNHTLTAQQQPFVQIIEAKVATNYRPKEWESQVTKQIRAMTSRGMTNVGLGNVLRDYVDQFWVNFGCGKAEVGYRIQAYTVTSPRDGLLLITLAKEAKNCKKKVPGEPVDPLPDPLPVPVPEPVPVPVPQPWPVPVPDPIPQPFDWGNLVTFVPRLVFALAVAQASSAWETYTEFMEWLRNLRFSKVWGDPHLITLDRLTYDMQSVGEFVLAESHSHDLRIHARFTERTDNMSIIDRVAMYVDDHVVEIGNNLVIDGEPVTLPDGEVVQFSETSGVLREGFRYLVFWDGMAGAVFQWEGSCCQAGLAFGGDYPTDLVGLLGNGDGNPGNDLKLRDGTQLPMNTPATIIHGQYADSWRISNEESLFTYAPGQSTQTFTDLTFPSEIVTIHDLTPEQVSAATTHCREQDVPPGPVFDACVIDIAVTSDTSFATMAAEQVTTVVDPLTTTLDAQGSLAVDFQASTMAKNLRPARVSQDTATSVFAGPFSGTDSYNFYVQQLPAHLNGTLAFDLLTVGNWTSDGDTETVTVRTDRENPVTFTPSQLTPTATGTLASGMPFAKYRLSVPFTHKKSQIEFTIDATGVAGISNQGFGVDNMQLNMPLVPPQEFQTSVPFSVSDGVPAAGAGNLETAVSADQYRFTLAQPGAIYIDVKECPSFQWTLLNQSGATVAYDYCSDEEVRNLPAGTYRLNIQARGDESGPYALGVTSIPADVSAPITIGGPPVDLSLTAPGQKGAWTFTGTAGQRVFLSFTDATFGSYVNADVSLKKPDGSVLRSWTMCGTGCFLDTVTLPVSGTYTVALAQRDASVGKLTAKITTVAADVSRQVPTNGTAVALTTVDAGQNGGWTFAGTAGQRMSFRFTAGTFDSFLHAFVSVRKPDGTNLVNQNFCGDSCFIDVTELPASGTYTIVFDPSAERTGSLSVGVTQISADTSATVTVGGPAVPLATTVPGQNGVWTFAGLAGQHVSFGFTGGTFDSLYDATVSVRKPDGATLVNTAYCGTSCSLAPAILPVDGDYTIVLNPEGSKVGSLSAKLDVGDVTKNVTVGGPASTITLASPGQNGHWKFTGTQGQHVSFGFTNGTFGSLYNARVSVKNPDGTTLITPQFCGTSCSLTPATLPTNGTYTVALIPEAAYTGSLTAKIDTGYVTNNTTIGAPASTITLASPGQNGHWKFTGTQGQHVSFGFTNGTFGSLYNARVSVKNPDGTTLITPQFCGTSCSLTPATLPTNGTYTVALIPEAAYTGSLTAKIDTGYVTNNTTIGAPASTITLASPGQDGMWKFPATANKRVYLRFTGGTFSSLFDAKVSLKNPDGSILKSNQACGTSCQWETTVLPVDGTYTILLDGQETSVGALTMTLTEVPADVTTALTVNGGSRPVTTTGPGQNASFTFSGTAGQTVTVTLTGNTYGYTSFVIRKPDGTTLTSNGSSAASYSFSNLALPATGTYTIFVDPPDTAIGTISGAVTR